MDIGPMTFEGSILLMIAILFGLVAVVITFMNSRKLRGEVFEMPFIYFTLGIFFVTLSLIDVTFFGSFLATGIVALIHDLSFIVGLAFMLTASMKITRYLQGIEKVVRKVKKVKKKR